MENLVFNNFSTGTNTNELKQANNTFQVLDNFSKVIGRHTVKVGGEFHYDQVNVNPIAQFNGNFLFTGSETGVDYADFLLGIPSQYNQSQLNPFYGRNKYAGVFAQDSWHAASNLTLNYGLRWDRIEPWYEKYNQISTTELGKQSAGLPGRLRSESCTRPIPESGARLRLPATNSPRASGFPTRQISLPIAFSGRFSEAPAR